MTVLRARLTYLAALAGAGTFYIFYTAWFSWYLLAFLLSLPVLSLICSLPAMLTVRLALSCPESVTRGKEAALEAALQCRLPVPPCRFRLRIRGTMTGLSMRRRLRFTARERLCISLPTDHCALLLCTTNHCRVCDYLGLIALPLRSPAAASMAVLPVPRPPETVPDLSSFRTPALQPKAGGGPAEVYELRPYRPGDPLRDIHWKLSAKTGEPVVRQAMESRRSDAVISFDWPGNPDRTDVVLDRVLWVSGLLLQRELPHRICFRRSPDGMPAAWTVESEADQQALLFRLLRERPVSGPTLRAAVPGCGWHCHISGEEADPNAT